jgi:peptidoglycan-associated lipoprotein
MRRLMIAVGCLMVLTVSACTRAKVVKPNEPVTTVELIPPDQMTPEQEAELAAILSGAVIHFDYMEVALTQTSQARLQRIADALRVRPWATIRIEGNCDERGTEEYNLALGQSRAEVARRYLISLGVDPDAVQTVSYGFERPLVNGHDEDAWAWNRRDEIKPVSSQITAYGVPPAAIASTDVEE